MRRPVLLVLALGVAVAGAAGEARSEPPRGLASPEASGVTGPDARSEPARRAESSGWSQELERSLMSPYCPGRSLTECPSEKATELRLWIQGQERAGVPREQVEARLFQQFGDQLRHGPRAEGWGLWAYLVPFAALAAGGALVFAFLRRQGRPASPPEVAPAHDPVSAARPRDPELERRLDEELGATS